MIAPKQKTTCKNGRRYSREHALQVIKIFIYFLTPMISMYENSITTMYSSPYLQAWRTFHSLHPTELWCVLIFATHSSRNRTVGVAFVLYPKNVPESKQPAHALALGVPLLRVLRASGLLIFRYHVPLSTHSLCYVVQRKIRRKDRHRMQNVESSTWADLELKSEKKAVRTASK